MGETQLDLANQDVIFCSEATSDWMGDHSRAKHVIKSCPRMLEWNCWTTKNRIRWAIGKCMLIAFRDQLISASYYRDMLGWGYSAVWHLTRPSWLEETLVVWLNYARKHNWLEGSLEQGDLAIWYLARLYWLGRALISMMRDWLSGGTNQAPIMLSYPITLK